MLLNSVPAEQGDGGFEGEEVLNSPCPRIHFFMSLTYSNSVFSSSYGAGYL